MSVPNTFANATTAIPLVQLDQNFNTGITLGNTTVYLGNTTTSFGNVTLTGAAVNGTVGATTPNTGSFTTITASGTATVGSLVSTAPIPVTEGGTGRATGTTAYGLIAVGTTATGAQQTLAAGGTDQILVGGGASALPVWTTATGTGAPVRAANSSQTGTSNFEVLITTGNVTLGSQDANTTITVGNASGANAARINMIPNSSGINWSISSSWFTGGALEFTPSTASGGSTFTTPKMSLNSNGVLAVTPTASLSGSVAYFQSSTTGKYALSLEAPDVDGFSGTAAIAFIGRTSATNRSINTGGSINASGSDGAEYERLCAALLAAGGVVAKGQIIGFDSDGKITDRWADAVSFGVKSTDPGTVGGDTWGAPDSIGLDGKPIGDRPRPPEPERNEFEHPGEMPKVSAYENDVDGGIYSEVFDAKLKEWEFHKKNFDSRQRGIDSAHAAALAQYEKDKAVFEVRLEAVRQTVDRIAYWGKVPVNAYGAKAGDYIIPIESNGGISGKLVDRTVVTFEQYRIAVGQVRRILPDGRAEIAVKAV